MKNDNHTKQFIKKLYDKKLQEILKKDVIDIQEIRKLKKSAPIKNILVVDDEVSIRKSLKRILEKEGYNVLLASEAAELSTIVTKFDISLILLDINLPWIDGYDLCKLMKTDDVLSSIPIVFISGYKAKENIKKGFDVGCDDYITKPFQIEEVSRAVKTLLSINPQ